MPKIPKEIQQEVLNIVAAYNEEYDINFAMSFRGKFAYLTKIKDHSKEKQIIKDFAKKMGINAPIPHFMQDVTETKIGRLTYNGKMDNWDFAVFRYSREKYYPDERMFPGSECLDGTITGALEAGEHLYP